MQQWAFKKMARGLPLSDVLGANTGENIRVGIFDTSPLVGLLPVGMVNAHVLVTWSQPTSLTFTLSHPAIYPIAGAPATVGGAEHGFFIAGLIHGLAPNSQLSLIRVLNDDGLGALSDLRRELYNFMWTNLDEKGRLDKVIINLSLGVHQPTSDLEALEESIDLFWPLANASTLGALVVAASGNDSGEGMAPQDRPALYPFVLGVAATTPDDARACYSNPGDVAAPGGDGGDDGSHPCAPIARLVCSDADCANGLMSIVTGTTAPLTGYAYWAGTSFATPLVSALAALIWAKDPGLTADDITTVISSRAIQVGDSALGAGVSNAACILLPPASQPGECPP
jgi:subtilisin family serine protease